MPATISLKFDNAQFTPGDDIEGEVRWDSDQPVQSAVIRLFWYTEGKGTQDVEIVAEQAYDAPALSDHRSFQFTAPASPYSFDGTLISLTWALEFVIQPGSQTVRQPIFLSPDGETIDLQQEVAEG